MRLLCHRTLSFCRATVGNIEPATVDRLVRDGSTRHEGQEGDAGRKTHHLSENRRDKNLCDDWEHNIHCLLMRRRVEKGEATVDAAGGWRVPKLGEFRVGDDGEEETQHVRSFSSQPSEPVSQTSARIEMHTRWRT